jgi:hypothetical protein
MAGLGKGTGSENPFFNRSKGWYGKDYINKTLYSKRIEPDKLPKGEEGKYTNFKAGESNRRDGL